MTEDCGVQNALAKFATKRGAGAVTTSADFTDRWGFLSETMSATQAFLRSETLTGSVQRRASNNRKGAKTIGGGFVCNPSVLHLQEFLYLALGSETDTPTGKEITPAEAVPPFAVLLDKVSKVYQYHDAYVSQLALTGNGPGLLTMTPTIVCRGHQDGPAFPAALELEETDEHVPLQFADLTLNVQGSEYSTNSFTLTIDNFLNAILRNSITPNCVRRDDFAVTLGFEPPSNPAVLAVLEEPDLAGLSATLDLVYGSVSASIELNALQKPLSHPNVPGKGEQVYPVTLEANQTGADLTLTPAITVTTDSNPA